MVVLPSVLDRRACLLVSMDLQDLSFPSLILCQVCHAHQSETGPFRTGLEFVTREMSSRAVPPERRRDLPGAVFDYSAEDREQLNRTIMGWPANMEFNH